MSSECERPESGYLASLRDIYASNRAALRQSGLMPEAYERAIRALVDEWGVKS